MLKRFPVSHQHSMQDSSIFICIPQQSIEPSLEPSRPHVRGQVGLTVNLTCQGLGHWPGGSLTQCFLLSSQLYERCRSWISSRKLIRVTGPSSRRDWLGVRAHLRGGTGRSLFFPSPSSSFGPISAVAVCDRSHECEYGPEDARCHSQSPADS